MPKAIKERDLVDFPFEDDAQYGRSYIRKLFENKGAYQERQQAQFWERLFVNMALSTVKWNNVPAGIDTRAMEWILLYFGCGGMFMDDNGHLFAQASYSGMMNMYWNPNETLLCAPNGLQWTRHAESWVKDGITLDPDTAICWDNMLRVPLVPMLKRYAMRIARYDSIMDTNIEAQRTPWMVAAAPENKRNAQVMQHKLETNDQYWKLMKGQEDTLPYVLNTQAPFVADKVNEQKHVLINEALTLIGVDNSNIDKKERVQTAEVLSNNEQIMAMRESRLRTRERFCKRCNVLFGTDMSVEWGIEGGYADIIAAMGGGGLNSILTGGDDDD